MLSISRIVSIVSISSIVSIIEVVVLVAAIDFLYGTLFGNSIQATNRAYTRVWRTGL